MKIQLSERLSYSAVVGGVGRCGVLGVGGGFCISVNCYDGFYFHIRRH